MNHPLCPLATSGSATVRDDHFLGVIVVQVEPLKRTLVQVRPLKRTLGLLVDL